MKNLVLSILFCSSLISTQAQLRLPAPSPKQTIKQSFALGSIELSYSRPSIKGRQIFGDVVPYDMLWRTGANNATVLHFSEAVEFGGKKIDSGSYALYTIPNEDSWDIILNRGVTNWGTEKYRESDDVVRFKVPVKRMKQSLETFTMQFADFTLESCALHLMWEKTSVAIPIKSDIKERLRSEISTGMQNDSVDKRPYWEAAQFYREYDHNDVMALENIKSAVVAAPKAYYMWLYKAKIEKDLGDKTAAKTSAETALQLAREAKSDDYIKMDEDLLKKLK